MNILRALVTVYIVILVARALLSWFPIPREGPMATIYRLLIDLTEPVLAPMRRIIPPAGGLDFSIMILLFILFILQGALH